MELKPDDACCGQRSHSQITLPPATRTFGRIFDDKDILPGDLLLTRPFGDSGLVSNSIVKAQSTAFHAGDAQWTHAAVCLGDGEHICEANFGISGKPNGVIVRPLNDYADGKHAVKIRRPIGLNDQQRYRVAIGALTSLRKSYSFNYLMKLSYRAWRGQGMWDNTHGPVRIDSNAVVCSTLYHDALQYGANVAVSRTSNLCTPAHLSQSPLFDDTVPIGWLQLVP